MSRPPNIGEPTKNAKTTMPPKTIPVMMNRVFILTSKNCQDKKQSRKYQTRANSKGVITERLWIRFGTML